MAATTVTARRSPRWVPAASDLGPCVVPAVAAASLVGALALVLHWQGGDLAAQLFRAQAFRDHGPTLWNPNWYGGAATLGYSVLTPALGSVIPPMVLGVLAGVAAAGAFAGIVARVWGPDARVGAVVFAVGTGANLAVGRITFAVGFALALLSLAALVVPDRPALVPAGALGLAASLASPVAGLFLAIALAAWGLVGRRRVVPAMALGAVTLAPLLLAALWFPAPGSFPYRGGTFLRDLGAAAVVFAVTLTVTNRRVRGLQVGIALYALVCLAAFVVATPLGANVSRLGQFTAAPLLACLLWPRHRAIVAVLVVPLLAWQWLPAYDGIVRGPRDPAAHASYFDPVLDVLEAQPGPIGRIEVPPLRRHWEAVHLGRHHLLARGWERQLDVGYHQIFYDGTLDADTYRSWLVDNGVEFVALADAQLEGRGVAEAALLRTGLPYLQPVLRSAHWQVWRVVPFQGLVQGPGRLTDLGSDHLTVTVTGFEPVTVRVRWSPRWRAADGTCPVRGPGGWLVLPHPWPGVHRLTQELWPLRCPKTTEGG